jgi:CRP/FNR family transcriptional regulator
MIEELKASYGYLFEDDLLEEIQTIAKVKQIPEGFQLIDIGEHIQHIPLLVSGAIKVMREDALGDELILYYVEQGDTCAVSLSCCMHQAKSSIRAVAEVPTTLILVPISKMLDWLSKYRSWQMFIMNSYSERLSELFDVVDTIAFLKMDERILKYLKDKAIVHRNEVIEVTHKEIALDLHSSRVVISRVLKKLERDNKIELQRNAIKLLAL